MTLKLDPTVYRTDYDGGHLRSARTGASVPVSDMAAAIAAHFASGGAWEDFPAHGHAAARTIRDQMVAAGLLIAGSAPTAPEHPGQTMFDLPFRDVSDIQPGEIVFLGAPIDIGTTGLPGARLGPDAIRLAATERYRADIALDSGRLRAWNVPSLGGAVLGGARLSDLGNVIYAPGEPAPDYYARLRGVVDAVYAAGGFPVVLGGDHSITYATIRGPGDALVHLDAHCDMAERVDGHCHHHGNVIRRLIDEGRTGPVHHFGLRDTSGWDTADAGSKAMSVFDLDLDGWSDGIAGQSVFISLDVDVLDPTVCPGTGTPVIGGLSLTKLCATLARIMAVTRPVGMDVVELSPLLDPTRNSERATVEAILCAIALYHRLHVAPEA